MSQLLKGWVGQRGLSGAVSWDCGPRTQLFGSYCQLGLTRSGDPPVFVAVTLADRSLVDFNPRRAGSNTIPGTKPRLARALVASISTQVVLGVGATQ